MKKQTKLIALTITALTILISVVAAAGYLMNAPSSPNVTTNPSPSPTPSPSPAPATLSAVTVNATTCTVGDWLTLSTTVSDHTAGIIVTFTAVIGGSNVGTATTDASGLATLTFQPTIGSTRYSASAVHP